MRERERVWNCSSSERLLTDYHMVQLTFSCGSNGGENARFPFGPSSLLRTLPAHRCFQLCAIPVPRGADFHIFCCMRPKIQLHSFYQINRAISTALIPRGNPLRLLQRRLQLYFMTLLTVTAYLSEWWFKTAPPVHSARQERAADTVDGGSPAEPHLASRCRGQSPSRLVSAAVYKLSLSVRARAM